MRELLPPPPPEPASHVIQPGDEIEYAVIPELTAGSDGVKMIPIRVGDDGLCTLPLLPHPLPLAGLTVSDAAQVIVKECIEHGEYRQPTATVRITRPATNRILVLGALNKDTSSRDGKEGRVCELRRGPSCTVTRAIQAAGGIDKDEASPFIDVFRALPAVASATVPGVPAGTAPVQLASYETAAPTLRGQWIRLDMENESHRAEAASYLEDGSVVWVRERKIPPVYFDGVVEKPGSVKVPVGESFTLRKGLSEVGGHKNHPFATEVWIERQHPGGGAPIKIQLWLPNIENRAGQDILLAPGDIVTVPHTPLTILWEMFKRVGISAPWPGQ